MKTISDGESQKANQLRKEGKVKEALEIYSKLWKNGKDPYTGAGYLHCLRKTNQIKKALDLAYELISLNFDIPWVRSELIWIFIQGELNECSEFSRAIPIAEKIMQLQPDENGTKTVVRLMSKLAIDGGQWGDGEKWLDRVKKDTLTDQKLGDSEWTEKITWYYRKIKCLFEQGKYGECVSLCDEIEKISLPDEVGRFILRIKAKALAGLGRYDLSIGYYEQICKFKAEWWMLAEYAEVLNHSGKKEDALKKYYEAVSSFNHLDKMVGIFDEIGLLCKDLSLEEEAFAHFNLEKLVRDEQGWKIKDSLNSNIQDLINKRPQISQHDNIKDALNACRDIWKKAGVQKYREEPPRRRPVEPARENHRQRRTGLNGIVKMKDGPFFFIKAQNESIICFKKEISGDFSEGEKVLFDAEPSFDRKKNIESWKAINVKKS